MIEAFSRTWQCSILASTLSTPQLRHGACSRGKRHQGPDRRPHTQSHGQALKDSTSNSAANVAIKGQGVQRRIVARAPGRLGFRVGCTLGWVGWVKVWLRESYNG